MCLLIQVPRLNIPARPPRYLLASNPPRLSGAPSAGPSSEPAVEFSSYFRSNFWPSLFVYNVCAILYWALEPSPSPSSATVYSNGLSSPPSTQLILSPPSLPSLSSVPASSPRHVLSNTGSSSSPSAPPSWVGRASVLDQACRLQLSHHYIHQSMAHTEHKALPTNNSVTNIVLPALNGRTEYFQIAQL